MLDCKSITRKEAANQYSGPPRWAGPRWGGLSNKDYISATEEAIKATAHDFGEPYIACDYYSMVASWFIFSKNDYLWGDYAYYVGLQTSTDREHVPRIYSGIRQKDSLGFVVFKKWRVLPYDIRFHTPFTNYRERVISLIWSTSNQEYNDLLRFLAMPFDKDMFNEFTINLAIGGTLSWKLLKSAHKEWDHKQEHSIRDVLENISLMQGRSSPMNQMKIRHQAYCVLKKMFV